HLILRQSSDVKNTGAFAECQLSIPRCKRNYIDGSPGIEPGIIACRERDCGFRSVADVDPIAERNRRIDCRFSPALIGLILFAGLSRAADITSESVGSGSERNRGVCFDSVSAFESGLEDKEDSRDDNSGDAYDESYQRHRRRNFPSLSSSMFVSSTVRHGRTPLS